MKDTAMGKLIWVTPVYLAVAWALMISYQLFTETAVHTVVNSITIVFPATYDLLISRIDMIVVINAFAWVFVLSSVIPSIILGKERSILVQFFVCLTLTVVSFLILDVITMDGPFLELLQGASFLFNNLLFALLYLILPYIAMFILDWHLNGRFKQRRKLNELTQEYLENADANEPEQADQPEQAEQEQADEVDQAEQNGQVDQTETAEQPPEEQPADT